MNANPSKFIHAALLSLGASLTLAAAPALAASTDLANAPLANATTTEILPNILFDLDNSGSMDFPYMPDYVRQTNANWWQWCRGTDSKNTLVTCERGDPPTYLSTFNTLYYNPNTNYAWPVTSTGARLADVKGKTAYASPWNAVASDGYGIQSIDATEAVAPSTRPCATGSCTSLSATATVDLLKYPERMWCEKENLTNCRSAVQGSEYAYPNNTYKYLGVRYSDPFYYTGSVEWCKNTDTAPNQNYGKPGTCQAKKDATYKYVRFYNWNRVDIKNGVTLPPKHPARTDCAGAICTYAEEMTNFATWFAWYRSRMQMTKSAIGLAFRDVRGTAKTGADLKADPADANALHARVGLTTINSPVVVDIANFDAAQKATFYAKLYGAVPSGGTPLRTSLDRVGKIFQGTSSTFKDPVQFSCQRNFTILATDGYWNDSYSGVGDTDGVATATLPSKDTLKTADTLADVAYYYYHTDLRPEPCNDDKCTDNVPPSGSNAAVDDIAQHQHMTTFTVSLGIDGTLSYNENYKTATSGDYFDIKQGTKSWPKPTADAQETIDDLWHAAVNGRGTYFSTRDPGALEDGLKRALSSIERTTGSGGAAATSNLQPTAGDNFIYIATYRTVKWDGEISAYELELDKGVISSTVKWQADVLLKARITPAGNGDDRIIYTADGNTRTLFKEGTGGLTPAQLALFDNTKLSQYIDWSATQKTATTPAMLVNYLRGQDRLEDQDRPDAYGTYERLYRDREKVLGDIVHAQPIYVKAPPHNFTDAGYLEFKENNANRAGTLYVASNDGMLHAFNADNGQERWAYVPPMVLPEMWRLADLNYEKNHRYFLDGPLTISDAKIGGVWKTVLIGAMGKGGRGYYALDITNPTDPKPLWQFSAADNNNVGYSYGIPFINKMADGTWVAILSSGYNNTTTDGGSYPKADGQGHVFVLNLTTGALIKDISTKVGTDASPSGLARLNVRVDKFDEDATAKAVYGGDLYGNMWRFNLETGAASKVAELGASQPIMVAPEISTDKATRFVLYFGTGRYLGDTDLVDKSVQTMYAIVDDGSTVTKGKTGLVQKTFTTTGPSRSIVKSDVDLTKVFGWYMDFPAGERVSIDPHLFDGTLIFATTVPTATPCQPGGYSWLYQVNNLTGNNVLTTNPVAGTRLTSPVVGVTVAELPGGNAVIYAITADGKKPDPLDMQRNQAGTPGSEVPGTARTPKRVLWRELFD